MTAKSRVKEGNCVSSLAAKHGLLPESIWDHPENAGLKKSKAESNILYPDQELFIPVPEPRVETGGTEQRHRFRRKAGTENFSVQILDCGDPVADAEYVIDIDGELRSGTTDGDGVIDETIAPNAKQVRVVFEDLGLDYDFSLGALDPVDTDRGILQRLENLGYEVEAEGVLSAEELSIVVAEFQADQGLEPAGEIDEELRAKLVEVHGC